MSKQSTVKINLDLDYKIVTLVLLGVIILMLFIWKPWQGAASGDRTVEVTGQATISARPDEFTFYPTYNFKNSDKDTAIQALTEKNNEVIAKLKDLGVNDSKIKSNSDGWSYPVFGSETDSTPTYALRLTITTESDDLAQKVQDYLLTTAPEGTITPNATFSETKQKELEDQARDKASKDARKKADRSAENLGFKVSKVKKVTDGAGFGAYPLYSERLTAMDAANSSSSIALQPGENELIYSVSVVYFIK